MTNTHTLLTYTYIQKHKYCKFVRVCVCVFIMYFQNPVSKAIESKSHTDTLRTHTQTHTDSHAHTGEKIKAAPYQTAATKRRDKNKITAATKYGFTKEIKKSGFI